MPISFTLQCDTAEELRAALGVLAPSRRMEIQWRSAEPEASVETDDALVEADDDQLSEADQSRFAEALRRRREYEAALVESEERLAAHKALALSEALMADAPIGDGIEHAPEAPASEEAKPARRTRKPKEPVAEEPATEQTVETAPVSDLMDDPETPAAEPEPQAAEITIDDCKRVMVRVTASRAETVPVMNAYFKENFGGAGTISTLDPQYYAAAHAYLLDLVEKKKAQSDG